MNPVDTIEEGLSMQFGMILYTVNGPAKDDLPGTLKRVRDIGFEYVQWSGMPKLPADEIRQALDAAGLQPVACHCGIEPFEEDFESEVAFWRTVGVTDVAPGGMMRDCNDSLEAWLSGAKRLGAVGAKLRAEGIRLSYHNHAHEFEKFDGDNRCKLDILYEETSPDNLKAELDLGWVSVGGPDPAGYLRKYAGRCPVVHVKDPLRKLDDGGMLWAPVGQGQLDYAAIFDVAREAGVEWLIYEQDNCEGDIWDSVAASYAFMKEHVG
jgi:sugar phosphate isomerase/epimerase